MAGNYPDPFGNRLHYDRDGSVGFAWRFSNNIVTQTSDLGLRDLNTEAYGGGRDNWGGTEISASYGLIFPSPRTITGFYLAINFFFGVGPISLVEMSDNTTTGQDGTWTTIASGLTADRTDAPSPDYRFEHHAVSGTGRALRITCYQGNASAHQPHTFLLYGTVPTALDRVQWWHPDLSQPLSTVPGFLEWSEVPRGSSETRRVRLRNASPNRVASNVVCSVEALADTDPSIPPQFTMSKDGVNFTGTITFNTMTPGQVSDVWVKRTIRSDAALGIWASRLVAAPGGMT